MVTRLHCWLISFIETLRGLGRYEYDGHEYDDATLRFEVRQFEYLRCARCHQEVLQGWHRLSGGSRP